MKINIPNFDNIPLLVIGDVMLDRYWYGEVSRISPEAPVPILKVGDMQVQPGGAGNVAVNLQALGCRTSLAGVIGDDYEGQQLQAALTQQGIQSIFQMTNGIPTTSKLRVIGQHQQLIRLDFEKTCDANTRQILFERISNTLNAYRGIIFSDYGKGVLVTTQPLIQAAKHQGIPTFVDPKSNDFSIYRGATLVTPNTKEFETIVGKCHCEDDFITRGQALLAEHDITMLLITRSERGMLLLQQNQPPLSLGTHAREVFDVTGAGDTVIATFAASLVAGVGPMQAARLANTAAGIVVRKLGTATATLPEIRRALQRQYNSDLGILTEEELIQAVVDARAHGESIVMTNGCFDIIHAGHIAYLDQAKSMAKRLVVAVNDDESVKRLKGSTRPVNSLKNRMAVLAGLRSVDWVVPFSEDTPERLIKRIMPDFLVKGADYKLEEIAGAGAVIANGGKVECVDLVPGLSTTDTLSKI